MNKQQTFVPPSYTRPRRSVRRLGAVLRLRLGSRLQPGLRGDRHRRARRDARLRPEAEQARLGGAERDDQPRTGSTSSCASWSRPWARTCAARASSPTPRLLRAARPGLLLRPLPAGCTHRAAARVSRARLFSSLQGIDTSRPSSGGMTTGEPIRVIRSTMVLVSDPHPVLGDLLTLPTCASQTLDGGLAPGRVIRTRARLGPGERTAATETSIPSFEVKTCPVGSTSSPGVPRHHQRHQEHGHRRPPGLSVQSGPASSLNAGPRPADLARPHPPRLGGRMRAWPPLHPGPSTSSSCAASSRSNAAPRRSGSLESAAGCPRESASRWVSPLATSRPADEDVGLGGRFLVTLGRAGGQPWRNPFSPGDVVEARPRRAEVAPPERALVARGGRTSVQLAFDRPAARLRPQRTAGPGPGGG